MFKKDNQFNLKMQRRQQQPDSLRLCSTLAVLRHLHEVAEEIEIEYGDMSAEKTSYLSGIQGRKASDSQTVYLQLVLVLFSSTWAHL
jgi:hypothetical protein